MKSPTIFFTNFEAQFLSAQLWVYSKICTVLCWLRQYGLWNFQTGGTKLGRFLPKNQHAERKFLIFENWTNGQPQKLAKFRVFKVDYFFSCKKIEKDSDNFWQRKLTLKVKRLGDFALFDTFPLTQFSKFDNFLWVRWFLGKNLPNFVPPVWKVHNPYCHSSQITGSASSRQS